MHDDSKAMLAEQLQKLIEEELRVSEVIKAEEGKSIPNDLILFTLKKEVTTLKEQLQSLKLKLDPDIVA